MAKLQVDVEVNGAEKLDNLKAKTQGLDSSSMKLSKTWGIAGAAIAAGLGMAAVAGAKFEESLAKITGSTDTMIQSTKRLTGAFSALSAAILDATGISKAYQTVVNGWGSIFDEITTAMGGTTDKMRILKEEMKSQEEYLKKSHEANLKRIKARDEADAKAHEAKKKREMEDDIRRQKVQSDWEMMLAKEQEILDKKAAAADAAIYASDMAAAGVDQYGNSLDRAEEAVAANTEAIREETQALYEQQQAIEAVSASMEKQQAFRGSGSVTMSREQATNEMNAGFAGQGGYLGYQEAERQRIAMEGLTEEIRRMNTGLRVGT